jgi:hypothetical protein
MGRIPHSIAYDIDAYKAYGIDTYERLKYTNPIDTFMGLNMARKTSAVGALSQERIREVFDYDPNSGTFTWRKRTSNRVSVGDVAGVRAKNGYTYIAIDDFRLLAHRVVWFYVYGEWPENQIDHINRDRSDNRLVNLRLASVSDNACNGVIRSTNTSGFRGVSLDKRKTKKKWIAQIVKDGKQYGLGYFATKEEAYDAYREAARKLHGAFASSG